MNRYNNVTPYTYGELEEIEKEIYHKMIISSKEPSDVNFKNILSRETLIFNDKDYNLPQNIFIIRKYKGKTIVGRKILSVLSIDHKINAINCSMVTASMLLGILKTRSKKGRNITIEYYPFNNGEKITTFNEIKKDLRYDVYFPYKYREFESGKEEVSPKEGWSFNPKKKEYLGYGEYHIREYTKEYFQNFKLDNKVIYDPACSTGEFLYTFQASFPSCKTVGHDLSNEMVEYAKQFVDETLCCNAINSPLKEKSVDVLFLRFLNSEVVSTVMVHRIMKKMITKMKRKALIICFGHTPVLIKKEWFEENGLKVINSIGYDEKNDAIFQYYVLEVI